MKNIIAVLFAVCAVANAQVKSNDVGAKHFTGEITVNAKPDAVLAILTNCTKHCTLIGAKHTGGSGSMAKVGSVSSIEVDGDKGSEVVTYFKPGKELRISFEPDNGTYLCGEKWILTPSGKGTTVHYDETFTLSGPMDANSVNHYVQGMNKSLNDLKTWSETK
ncbi:MAG TPA: SRPBCC family protein [Candidatus Kapabacteria bacterium]|nr:SRPBCC family protein [Candidatus Kapabacteria bacterium]